MQVTIDTIDQQTEETEEMHSLRELKNDLDFWQQRYLDTLKLEDERMANLDYDEGGDMGN